MTRGNNVGSAFRRPLGVKSAIQTLVIIITINVRQFVYRLHLIMIMSMTNDIFFLCFEAGTSQMIYIHIHVQGLKWRLNYLKCKCYFG